MFTDARPVQIGAFGIPITAAGKPRRCAPAAVGEWPGCQGRPAATGLLGLELRLRLRELAQLLERTTENSRDLHLRHADHLRNLTLREVLHESE